MIHRGPDDSGAWIGHGTAIAMRRLSIIDLAGGHQPIDNETGHLHIVFNGEIYNYRELRSELLSRGHEFKTASDTEVVLHGFEEFGTGILDRLKGMFAFCIANERTGELFLARDRFGEKPLFYWNEGGRFAFSSELPSLLECQLIPRRLNLASLPYYLRNGFVPLPMTMYRDIHQVRPGHWMTWKQGKLDTGGYFAIRYQPDPTLDETTAKDLVRSAVLNAVERQRVSDVPIGAFLSGGIDSSTVVAALQKVSTNKIPTFTARFENVQYDESPIARAVANHVGTDHHEFLIPNQGFSDEDLVRVINHVGQPFGDSSAIPTYYICRQIREHVKVCLSGDGGDEMFGGYDSFQFGLKVDRVAKLAPRFAFASLGAVLDQLSHCPVLRDQPRLRQLRQVADACSEPADARFQKTAPRFDRRELKRLLSSEWYGPSKLTYDPSDDALSGREHPSTLRRLMAYRSGYSLSEQMLVKVDRMSMATSLEVRAPMLDVGIFEVASKMPDHLLIRGGRGKYILREAVKDWLPSEVFTHPKWGFAIPLHEYQNDRYRQMCSDLLAPGKHPVLDHIFRRDYLESIVTRGLARTRDAADVSVFRASHQVWQLVMFAAWVHDFDVSL